MPAHDMSSKLTKEAQFGGQEVPQKDPFLKNSLEVGK